MCFGPVVLAEVCRGVVVAVCCQGPLDVDPADPLPHTPGAHPTALSCSTPCSVPKLRPPHAFVPPPAACLSVCLSVQPPQDPQLLSHPLVSPTYAADVTGLCQAGMLVVAGGAELMRRDIQAFAAKAAAAAGGVNSRGGGGEAPTADTAAAAQGLDSTSPTEAEAAAAVLRGSDGEMGDVTDTAGQVAGSGTAAAAPPGDAGCRSSSSSSSGGCGCAGVSGFRVVYHEEPGEPHVYAMLMLPHLLQKGLVVPRFVAAVVKGQSLEEVVGRGSSSTPA